MVVCGENSLHFVILVLTSILLTSAFTDDSNQNCKFVMCQEGSFPEMNCTNSVKLKLCFDKIAKNCSSDFNYRYMVSHVDRYIKEHDCKFTVPNNPFDKGNKPISEDREIWTVPKSCKSPNVSITPRKYCAIFGDPHILTVENKQQTCRVLGAYPFVLNEYFTIQVTNSQAVEGNDTWVTSVTRAVLIVYAHKYCLSKPKTFMVSSDIFPQGFTDGTTSESASERVTVSTIIYNEQVVVNINFIGVIIIFSRDPHLRTISISVMMPHNFPTRNNKTLGDLCHHGCPSNELLSEYGNPETKSLLQLAPSQNIDLKQKAERLCSKKLRLKGFFSQTCIHDILVYGNVNASNAVQNMYDLSSKLMGKKYLESTRFPPIGNKSMDTKPSSCRRQTLSIFLIIFTHFMIFLNS